MTEVVVINGFPRSGKDEFVNQCKKFLGDRCTLYSSVDFVKELAKIAGWNGEKTPENRKFLSDLKDLLTKWADVPVRKMKQAVKVFSDDMDYYNVNGIIFLMVREPEEIERLRNEIGAKSLLIRRTEVEEVEQSNHADSQVLKHNYDYVVYNNGTIDDLKKNAEIFIKQILKAGI